MTHPWDESMIDPLRSGHPVPKHTRSDRHNVPRHVRVGGRINGRQTVLTGVRPDEQGPTNRGTAVPSYPPPSPEFQWVMPWMCPRVVLSASITLGPLIRAFLSTHWWDFSVPLGGGLRLEQLSRQGHLAPGQASGLCRRNTRSVVTAGSA